MTLRASLWGVLDAARGQKSWAALLVAMDAGRKDLMVIDTPLPVEEPVMTSKLWRQTTVNQKASLVRSNYIKLIQITSVDIHVIMIYHNTYLYIEM